MRQSCRIGSFAIVLIALWGCGGQTTGDDDADADAAPEQEDDAGLLAVPSLKYPSAEGLGGTTSAGIGLLNAYRTAVGLPGVAEDSELSAACEGHLRYLAWESTQQAGGECLLAHTEDNPSNPHGSAAHAAAGAGSLLACQQAAEAPLTLSHAVQRWVNSLYHRIPLLDPRLERVGAAAYGGYTCLYYAEGIDESLPGGLVLWPADHMTAVPTTFAGNETPCPTHPEDPVGLPAEQCPSSGFIPTATWYGQPHPLSFGPGSPTARLSREDTGTPIELLAVYASNVAGMDPSPGALPNTIALVPTAPLPKNGEVVVDIKSQGASLATWSFATGKKSE